METGQAEQKPVAASTKRRRRRAGPYTPEARQQAVEAYLKSGMALGQFARVWRITPRILRGWVRIYEQSGAPGLALVRAGRKRGLSRLPEPVRDEIVNVKRRFPAFGFKRIRAFLGRFSGIRVSVGSIRRTVREQGLPLGEGTHRRPRRIKRVRLFERARPGELWQSDWTSLVLPRTGQRLYLVAFIDDYSRYVISWGLHVSQRSEHVVEALREGIGRFGKPKEILTDQGRQYFAWRGWSEFQQALKREGIRHVVSRSHHPQTLGKCERFWATVQGEFWGRVAPQELGEARERFAHFVAHYNHFRPHQGIENLVPADRLFGAESAVRQSLEASYAENELALALGEPLRKPVYLTGQIGDTPVSLIGEKGKLIFQSGQGAHHELSYDSLGMAQAAKKEAGDGKRGREGEGGPDATGSQGGEEQTARRQEEGDVQDAAACGACERPAFVGELGGAAEGAPGGDANPGDVAGEEDAGANGTGVGSPDRPNETAGGFGAFRDGGGVVETAQEDAQGSCASGGRSEEAAQEDRGFGARATDAGRAGEAVTGLTGEQGAGGGS